MVPQANHDLFEQKVPVVEKKMVLVSSNNLSIQLYFKFTVTIDGNVEN